MNEIKVPLSPGELLDKITILKIKSARMRDAGKLVNVRLWTIEDDIRDKERAQTFDAEFVRLARAVYIENDERAAIKRRLNVKLGSSLIEEKSYAEYKS